MDSTSFSNILRARDFAIKLHGNQKYGTLPFSYHLDSVALTVFSYGPLAVQIAYLHDVLEDTEVTEDRLTSQFGSLVSRCVHILTDESGKNRKERKLKTYAKAIPISPKDEEGIALIVKVADRLSNVFNTYLRYNEGLAKMYLAERKGFQDTYYRFEQCEDLWKELDYYYSQLERMQ